MSRSVFISLVLIASAILVASVGAKGETGVSQLNGNQYYSINGDWSYSSWFQDGVDLSPGSGAADAAYALSVSPTSPCTDGLAVGLYYHDGSAFGNGPSILAYNWTSSAWDTVLANVGNTGSNSATVSMVLSPTSYIGSSGVAVDITADWLDNSDIGTVAASWTHDTTPASNPNSFTSSVPTDVWSSTRVVQVQWTGASDANGISGYSIEWSTSPSLVPDAIVDTTAGSATSAVLSDSPSWYLHVRAVDGCENWSPTAFDIGPFMVDGTAPPAPAINPVPAWSSDPRPTFTWTPPSDVSGIGGYSFSVDQPPDNSIDTIGQVATTPTLTEGSHIFYARAVDEAGNWGLPASVSFGIDMTMPTLRIDSPANGSWVATDEVLVTWTGSDAGSGISAYWVSFDLRGWTTAGMSTSYAARPGADGPHTAFVRAVDGAGNYADASVGFTLDTTVPRVTITSPAAGYLNDSSVGVTWTGSDETSGIEEFFVQLDGGSAVGVGAGFTHTFVGVSEGDHTILVKALDRAGNSYETSMRFTVDTIGPTLDVTTPKDGSVTSTNGFRVAWTGSDATSGIDHYTVQLDEGTPVNTGLNLEYTFAAVSDGSHTVRVTAIDKAGNAEAVSLTANVETSVVSPRGPYGVIPDLALLGIVVLAGIAFLVVRRRRKARSLRPPPPK